MKSKSEPVQEAPTPPPQVLSLVSAFLTEHGFERTTKALKKELKRLNQRVELDPVEEGVKLENIVESWNEKEDSQPASSSDEDNSADSDASSSGSDSESGSSVAASNKSTSSQGTSASDAEVESESEEEVMKTKPTKSKKAKASKKDASPAPSSSSSSESDADDENEDEGEDPATKIKSGRKKSPTSTKEPEPVRSLKRKAESSSPEFSSSESESPGDDRPAKRTKVASESEASSSSASEKESSDAETSSSEEEQDEDTTSSLAQTKSLTSLAKSAAKAPSDASSNTVMGDTAESGRTSSEPERSAEGGPPSVINKLNKQTAAKRKHVGAKQTPLAQLSARATADAHVSNAYQSYEYADRAYNDLSVTRGKGFTKEKNKKKRGSYRGGAIDISGGKGFKFED